MLARENLISQSERIWLAREREFDKLAKGSLVSWPETAS